MRTDCEPEGKPDEERARASAGLQSPTNGHFHLGITLSLLGGNGAGSRCLKAPLPGVPQGNKRSAKKELARRVEEQQAEERRSASLSVLHGMGEGVTTFEDMWNTTGFQLKMMKLCQNLYGVKDGLAAFNTLNDVRNDLTVPGKEALHNMFVFYSMLGGDRGALSGMGARSKTMDQGEFKQLLIDLDLYPSKKRLPVVRVV